MNTVDRPNRDALNSALDIYRDAMRTFIVRCLKKVQGTQVEDVIRNALNDRQAQQFNQNLRQNDDIKAAIDINDFPPLISRNYDIFREQFDGDMTVQNRLWLIKDARDKAAHPGQQDMDAEFVRTNLYQIADVLDKINVPTQKQTVEKIRNQLVTPSSQSDPAITPAQTQIESTTQSSRSNDNLTPWRAFFTDIMTATATPKMQSSSTTSSRPGKILSRKCRMKVKERWGYERGT